MTTQDERLGEVTEVADGVQVRFRRSWPDPIEDVWSALTAPARTARWFGSYDGERRVGGAGTLTMTHEEGATGEPMRIVECDPPHRLVVRSHRPSSFVRARRPRAISVSRASSRCAHSRR